MPEPKVRVGPVNRVVSHLLKCRCPRAYGMSMAVDAVSMCSSKSSSRFPWSLSVDDIVDMMFSLLSDRDKVSLPESPELKDRPHSESRASPPFPPSAGNESRRASGLDTSGGEVRLLVRSSLLCVDASNPMTRNAGTLSTRLIAVPSQYDSPESRRVASIFSAIRNTPLFDAPSLRSATTTHVRRDARETTNTTRESFGDERTAEASSRAPNLRRPK